MFFGVAATVAENKAKNFSFSLIVVINLLNRFVMFGVCACIWSALLGILETSLSSGFLWGGKNWNWLEESGGAPLDPLSSGEIVPCF